MRKVTSRILLSVAVALFVVGVGFATKMALSQVKAEKAAAAEEEAATELAVSKIELNASCRRGGFGTVAVWNITLRNTSDSMTFRDIRYRSEYRAESGTLLGTHDGTLAIVLQPYETRQLQGFNDGFTPGEAANCSMFVTGAKDY